MGEVYSYKIGYHSYEESSYTDLLHEKKFTEKELLAMLAVCFAQVGKDKDTIQDLYDERESIELLCKEFGFKRIEYQETVSLFGWTRLLDKNDWKECRDKEEDYLADKVTEIRRR